MTTQEFKKVGRLLKEVYAQLETEALADGVDFFSEEFIQVRDQLRLAVLSRMGFTLEEYRAAKELVAPAKKVDVAKDLLEASKLTQETSNRVDALVIPNEEELLAKAKEIAESIVKAPIIQNNIVERTTKVVEKPTMLKRLLCRPLTRSMTTSLYWLKLATSMTDSTTFRKFRRVTTQKNCLIRCALSSVNGSKRT